MKKMSITILTQLLSLALSACGSGSSDIPSVTPPEIGGDGDESNETVVQVNIDNTHPATDGNRIIYELNLYDFTSEGTLKAALSRLSVLRTLGVDIVWLMPIHDRGDEGKIGSLGSPYAPKDYYSVNPDFGTADDLRAFVAEAHRMGMKVWIDWVANHTGMDATWTKEHPEYYVTENGRFVHPNNYGDVYQLDMGKAETQQAMINAMKYWMKQADIDGFRCDYISSAAIPTEFWTQAIAALKEADPSVEILGEADFTDITRLFPCGFDYDYAWAFHNELKEFGTSADATRLKESCRKLAEDSRYDRMSRMVYLTNHDDTGNNFSSNYLSWLGNNVYPLTVLEFTLYGMPLLYNGQETGYRRVMNYFEREPIDWTAVDVKMQNTVRVLVALKHTQKALAHGATDVRGSLTFLDTSSPNVLAYKRQKGDNEVLVVINLLGRSQTVTVSGITPGEYVKWIDSTTIGDNTDMKKLALPASCNFTLETKGYEVYTLN